MIMRAPITLGYSRTVLEPACALRLSFGATWRWDLVASRRRESDEIFKFENVFFFEIVMGIIAIRTKAVSDALWSPPALSGWF